jgi:hypothetical protein
MSLSEIRREELFRDSFVWQDVQKQQFSTGDPAFCWQKVTDSYPKTLPEYREAS